MPVSPSVLEQPLSLFSWLPSNPYDWAAPFSFSRPSMLLSGNVVGDRWWI